MTSTNDDDLMVRYLEGIATQDEVILLETKLRADPLAQREFVRLAHLQALFIDLPRPPQVSWLRRTWRHTRIPLTAAAAVLVIGILWARFQPASDAPLITAMHGLVSCYRSTVEVPVHVGDHLRSGDRLTVASLSDLSLSWKDRTAVHVSADSTFTLGQRSGAMITLDSGAVNAVVVHDATRPFSMATPDGLTTDVGTDFMVLRDAYGTTVKVYEGVVALSNTAGQVTVPASRAAFMAYGLEPRLIPVEDTGRARHAPAPAVNPPVHTDGDSVSVSGTVTHMDEKRKSFTLVDDLTATALEYRAYYAGGHPETIVAQIAALHLGDHVTVTYIDREGRRVIAMVASQPAKKKE